MAPGALDRQVKVTSPELTVTPRTDASPGSAKVDHVFLTLKRLWDLPRPINDEILIRFVLPTQSAFMPLLCGGLFGVSLTGC